VARTEPATLADLTHPAAQLNYRSFSAAFGLTYDHQVEQLCKIFDQVRGGPATALCPSHCALTHLRTAFPQDNSNHISFREFMYGLSKFGHSSMDGNIKFAFLLLDTDRSGSLEEHELVPQLRVALSSPQYGKIHNPVSYQVDINYRCPIQAAVLQVMRTSGRTHITHKEFQVLCWRYPRLFAAAKFIYEHLYKVAKPPMEILDAMSLDAQAELLTFLNRPIPPSGKTCTSFDHYYHEDSTKENKPLVLRRLPQVKVPTPQELGVTVSHEGKINKRVDILVGRGLAGIPRTRSGPLADTSKRLRRELKAPKLSKSESGFGGGEEQPQDVAAQEDGAAPPP
jgi:Ca2+-binding EF-hand superfamily protein